MKTWVEVPHTLLCARCFVVGLVVLPFCGLGHCGPKDSSILKGAMLIKVPSTGKLLDLPWATPSGTNPWAHPTILTVTPA